MKTNNKSQGRMSLIIIILMIILILSITLVFASESLNPHLNKNLIKITNAEQLDKNRNPINNIFNQIKETDNIWKLINDKEYIRVTFEKNLTNKNDISVYARAISSDSAASSDSDDRSLIDIGNDKIINKIINKLNNKHRDRSESSSSSKTSDSLNNLDIINNLAEQSDKVGCGAGCGGAEQKTSIEVYKKNDNQLITTISNISNEAWYKTYLTGLEEGECYDNETEILTDEGWKLFKDLTKEEKVMTLNQETGEKEWQLPTEWQEFDNSKLGGKMYGIKTVDENGKEGELVVSEEHRVYSSSRKFLSSLVLNTSTESFTNCSWKCGSLDQMGMLSSNANAKKGTSVLCEISLDASCLKSKEGSLNSINSGSKEMSFKKVCLDIFAFEQTSLEYLCNSLINLLGANNLILCSFNNLFVNESFLNKENAMFVSATNSIYHSPLDMSFFNLLPSSMQSSSVSSEFAESLSNFSSISNCFILLANASLAIDDQFNQANLSIFCLNSFGTDKVSDGILTSYTYNMFNMFNNRKEVFKSFGLKPITEVYSNFNQGKQVYFLDKENNPVKIKSIEKVPYDGRIYDVDVKNNIILVRRKNTDNLIYDKISEQVDENEQVNSERSPGLLGLEVTDNINGGRVEDNNNYIEVWSGNSNSIFDLKVLGNIEIDEVVDPAGDTLYWVGVNNGNWSDASNWASSSGGAGGAGVPNATNAVVFDSADLSNSMINQSVSVYSLNVSSGYTGTINFTLNVTADLNITENFYLGSGATITPTYSSDSGNGTGRVINVGGNATILGTINGDQKGFPLGQGPGAGNYPWSGSSYGGLGGGAVG
ncbi:MAG: Hint domain-containing protein, partial [archaeon]